MLPEAVAVIGSPSEVKSFSGKLNISASAPTSSTEVIVAVVV